MPDTRTYEDRRPFAVPLRLADLTGPVSGFVELQPEMAWTGRRTYDLADPADVTVLYERAIVEASSIGDLARVLNDVRLTRVWPDLFLPRRVRMLWEARFPELVSTV